MSDVYTAATIHNALGIKPARLRQWVARGHVRRVGRDKYDGESVRAHFRASVTSTDGRDDAGRFTGRVSTPLSPPVD